MEKKYLLFKCRSLLRSLLICLVFHVITIPVVFAQDKNAIHCIQYPDNLIPRFISSINGEEIWAIFADQKLYKWSDNQFIDVSEYGETYDMLFAVGNSELWIHYFDQRTLRYKFRLIKHGVKVEFKDPDNFNLYQYWIVALNDIWACGIVGTLLHYDGNSWKRYPGFTNNHITRIFLNKILEGYATIAGVSNRATYKISLDSDKIGKVEKLDKEYSILGLFNNGCWAVQIDSLYFVSHKNRVSFFKFKFTPQKIIPYEKKTIFNSYGNNNCWYCYGEKGNLNHLLLLTEQFAVRLGDNGKTDTLTVERMLQNITFQFSIGTKRVISDFSAACGFFNKDSTLDIFSIIPTGNNFLKISREEKFGRYEGTQLFGLDEKQTTSNDKGAFYDNGVLLADFDNDLDQDIIITAHQGSNLFYENNANKVFANRTKRSGLFHEDFRNNMAIAGDVDNDGDLDLFITREYTSNVLYVNNGFGKFKEVTNDVNLNSERGGMGCAFSDIDSDGDLDLFVANWRIQNCLYRNEGINRQTGLPWFTEISERAGIVNDNRKRSNAATFGDVDNDGDLDLLVINRTSPNRFYVNDGTGNFMDVTRQAGLYDKNDIHNCAVFFDANHDGYLDIVISAKNKSLFYLNKGDGTFQFSPNSGLIQQNNGNAVITGDIDNDGDIDIYTTAFDDFSYVYENWQNDERFVKIQLVGCKCNRDAVGANVYFYPNGKIGMKNHLIGFRTVEAGSGLASTNSKIVHFGTGEHQFVDVRIKFPSGIWIDKINVRSGSFLTIEELQGWQKFFVLTKHRIAFICHSTVFWLELLVFFLVALLLFVLFPLFFRVNIKPILGYFVIPVLTIIIFRLLLSNESVVLRLIIANMLGVLTSLLVIQAYKQKLKKQEIDELIDHLWNELVQFQHGDWARSNLNQLLFFAKNIDAQNQSKKEIRENLLKSINMFIQSTYPAIRRIIGFAKNREDCRKNEEQLKKTSAKIYRILESSKNLIQLNEPLVIDPLTELAEVINDFKKEIDLLKHNIEKKYNSNLYAVLTPLIENYVDHKNLNIAYQKDTVNHVTVRIKPNELTVIVDNLILNAIAATKQVERPLLKIFGERNDERCFIHFFDNGYGIHEDKWEKIFDVGYSGVNGPDRGQGLSFSRKILKKYGGDIYVNDSEIGKGTDIVLELEKLEIEQP